MNTLGVYRNRLTSIPDFISEMAGLKYIRLGHNQITEVPESLVKLKKLQVLDLYENKIKLMPKNIGSFPALKRVELKRNPISPQEADRIIKALPNTKVKISK